MSLRKVVVGLGNPGKLFQGTPHNLGFDVVDLLAADLGGRWERRASRSLALHSKYHDLELVLAKPQTYMNRSGEAVLLLQEEFSASSDDLLVICDDLALPFGKIRIRGRGSAGGHRGLESIIEVLGHSQFTRIRLGVGLESMGDAAEYVLRPIDRSLKEVTEQMVTRANEAAKVVCLEGLKVAMNLFN